jgi:hypothetical protein
MSSSNEQSRASTDAVDAVSSRCRCSDRRCCCCCGRRRGAPARAQLTCIGANGGSACEAKVSLVAAALGRCDARIAVAVTRAVCNAGQRRKRRGQHLELPACGRRNGLHRPENLKHQHLI